MKLNNKKYKFAFALYDSCYISHMHIIIVKWLCVLTVNYYIASPNVTYKRV
jgi:hypothetical protein